MTNNVKKNYADMDPLEEVRAVREEISREFPSLRDLGEFLRKKYPAPSSPESPRKSPRSSAKMSDGRRPVMRQQKVTAHA